MTDSMKFGPEWLRNLSEAPAQPQPVRAQLAEFRYGREEMLALFSPLLTPPESLKSLTGLFVEKAQQPIALSTMTDEETRMWNRGINSDAVVRSGKGGDGRGAMRGAGGSNRGRGRGGPGGPVYYGRGGGIEPGGPRGPGSGYDDELHGRPTRTFDRSQSYLGGGDRRGGDSWTERNGGDGRPGGRSTEISWRRPGRISGEEDDWRPPKWSSSGRTNSGNWREEDNWDPIPHSKGIQPLPEWATEKNSEGGGTFDSSGAFRTSEGSVDDEDKSSRLLSRRTPGLNKPSEADLSIQQSPGGPLGKQSIDKEMKTAVNSNNDSGEGGGWESDRSDKNQEVTTELETNELLPEKQHSTPPHQPEKEPLPPEPLSPPMQDSTALSPSRDEPPRIVPSVPISVPPPTLTTQPPVQPPHVSVPPPAPRMVSRTLRSPLAPSHPPPLSPALDQPPPPIVPQAFHQPLPTTFNKPPPTTDPLLEDALSHMTDDIAADLVAKLMEDEENKDKQWYYRDPQGQVQGPFSCTEMSEWFESGYFTLNLLVRRACDPNYAPLGELIKLWGCIPFLPEHHPLNKEAAQALSTQQTQETQLYAQYQQYQRALLLRQQALARAQVHPAKLTHDWLEAHPVPPPLVDQVLPPQYQPQLAVPHSPHLAANSNNLRALLAQMQQQQNLQRAPTSKPPTMQVPRTTEEISRKVSDFLRGLQAKSEAREAAAQAQAASQQAASQAQGGAPVSVGGPPGVPSGVMDTIMSLHQQQTVGGGASPLQNLLRQMQQNQVKMQQQQQSQPPPQQHIGPPHAGAGVDSVWNASSWSQWSHPNPKGIKTEQQVLEEQLRAEDERKREELRKQEEAQRKAAQEAEEEEKAQKERVASIMVEESMREIRKAEELARRRQEEEDLRRKQEASRRAEVERQRKGEEKRKKEEEKRKKEEEKKERDRLRAEEERKKKELEEAKKRAAAAADVMAKVQRSQWCPPQASNTSILDIQRSEREQQMLRGIQQQAQQQAMEAAQQAQINKASGLQLKWTETAQRQPQQVESLEVIQAEQRQFFKQSEKEKAEREKEKQTQQNVGPGALGSWSQGLTWGSGLTGPAWQTSVNPVTNSSSAPNVPSGGFWDSVGAPPVSQPPKTAQPGSVQKPAGNLTNQQQQQQQQQLQQQQQQQAQQHANKEAKNKAKRDEIAVMKLFAVNSNNDEFTQWCNQTLATIQCGTPIDIPTFVTFLRDLESSEEVREYIKMYLGDTKESSDFARQFVERRSSSGSGGGHQAPSPTPANQDFQQVKGKNKKGKKGRMQRVDSRILNFSTTSASDRINVGDRQYPDFE